MTDDGAPWHAHVYYADTERAAAASLRDTFAADPAILFAGALTDHPVGPHPMPQFEVHFLAASRADVVAKIAATHLRALVHPLTDDDLADHTSLGHWIGEPLNLDLGVLDPVGENQGVARFGKGDF